MIVDEVVVRTVTVAEVIAVVVVQIENILRSFRQLIECV